MIPISILKAYFDALAPRVQATKAILVRNETELAQKIKQITAGELFLVVVVPSSDTSAMDNDNILEKEQVIVYAVKKVSHRDQDDTDMLADMLATQVCITAVKTMLYADAENHSAAYHQYIKRIDFNRMHTDPEYNYFECDGYSLSFVLTSPGF